MSPEREGEEEGRRERERERFVARKIIHKNVSAVLIKFPGYGLIVPVFRDESFMR